MQLKNGDALIVVDVQRDFLPGGSLAVPHGDEVIPAINAAIAQFQSTGLPVVATRDWHPPDHCSFVAQGGSWPSHCIKDTPGAAFPEQLELPDSTMVISKGTEADREAYSGFEGTGLGARLHALDVKRVFVGGLATDYCVRATVQDAVRNGFDVVVLREAVRAVNIKANDEHEAIAAMRDSGAAFVGRGAFNVNDRTT